MQLRNDYVFFILKQSLIMAVDGLILSKAHITKKKFLITDKYTVVIFFLDFNNYFSISIIINITFKIELNILDFICDNTTVLWKFLKSCNFD